MKNYNNEILNDCSWFAEKYRDKNKTSGPHWSTIIRFPKLFDEAVRLQNLVSAYENDLVLLDVNEKLEKAQARIAELEEKNDLVLSQRNHAYDTLGWSREISIDEFTTIQKLEEEQQLISVYEKLPEIAERVLTYSDYDAKYHVGFYVLDSNNKKVWVSENNYENIVVTHWKHLPQLPKEEK